jgi:glucokinase
MDLIADIGATNSRCALVDQQGRIVAQHAFKNADFDGLESLLHSYLSQRRGSDQPRNAAFAVAAPILEDKVRMTNIGWQFSQTELRERLQLNQLSLMNDFAAIAFSLPYWQDHELYHLGGGEAKPLTTVACLGPGSGLGVASLVHGSEGWNIVAGEGGHVSLAAQDDAEAEVIAMISDEYGHCSAERVLSGPGLVLLYRCLAQRANRTAATLTPQQVTELARHGDALARETLAWFFRFLGGVAGDLALTTGAIGGVFVAGGIVPQLLDEIADSDFRRRFENKGRYQGYMERIPTRVIIDPVPAFRGLARHLGYGDR